MLTFFRRIRKGFLGSGQASKPASPARPNGFLSGRTGRYLLYAVGEIVLVVLGILIALQINNWNEWRKERALEDIVLEDIKDNIIRNDELIHEAIKTIEQIDRSTQLVRKQMENKVSYDDTLSYYIDQALRSGTFLFKLNFDGYESLKSTGFNLIQNEELKDEILSLFEVTYGYVLTTLHFANSFYLDDLSWWKKHFYIADQRIYVPYDKEGILQDKEFLTNLNDIAFIRNDFCQALRESLPKSQKVLQLIKDKLDEK